MKFARPTLSVLGVLALGACAGDPVSPTAAGGAPALSTTSAALAVNVLLTGPLTAANRAELARFGRVHSEIPEINALTMRVQASQLAALEALPFVAAAGPDQERTAVPVDASALASFAATGINSWNQDAINVTNHGEAGRTVAFDGTGVYVGVLDTGLLNSWRQYFPAARIATAFARSFTGSDNGTVAEQPNKWEQDQDSHGTHVTSTILGYSLRGTPVNGTAPNATVIPVKVLNQNGSGWSSMIAAGIMHIAELKAGALRGHPVVINMSLGGPSLDAVEKAAIDYAVDKGVIIVASAGNSGMRGMGYPGAYAPVISVASVAWKNLFTNPLTWRGDVAENDLSQFTISTFSSRALGGRASAGAGTAAQTGAPSDARHEGSVKA